MNLIRSCSKRNFVLFCASYFGIEGLIGPPPARAEGVAVTGRVAITQGVGEAKRSTNSSTVVWLTPRGDSPGAESRDHDRRQCFRLVQKHKRFDPHLLVVPVGSTIEFPNLDPFFHNVFSLFEGKRFDLGLYEAGTTRGIVFDRPGVSYIFCNIHSEMSAIVIVVRSPYYGVSDKSGELTIPNVSPGRFDANEPSAVSSSTFYYVLKVWHESASPEVLEGLTREITVSDDSASFGTLRLKKAGSLKLAHKNLYGRDYEPPTPPSPLYDQP